MVMRFFPLNRAFPPHRMAEVSKDSSDLYYKVTDCLSYKSSFPLTANTVASSGGICPLNRAFPLNWPLNRALPVLNVNGLLFDKKI